MPEAPAGGTNAKGQGLMVAMAWVYVGIPLAWGVTQTVIKSIALFK